MTPTRTILTGLLAILLLAGGCAHSPMQQVPATISVATLPPACAGLNQLNDEEAALRLDMVEEMLRMVRARTGKSNEDVCGMPTETVARVLVAERQRYKNPDRKKFRAPAKEWMREWDRDDEGRLPTATQILDAEQARKNLIAGVRRGSGPGESALNLAAGLTNTQWSELGPSNIGGRIRAIAIDPRNQNRVYIGAASGGVWLTENAGQTFRPLQEFMASLTIGAMEMDPNNPNVIYAGTGESFAGLAGIGMFKTTDGGTTWNFLPATTTDTALNTFGADWVTINRIAVSPANSSLVLAATGGGLFRSTNGGTSWTKVETFDVIDLRFDPNDAEKAIAAGDQGFVAYSSDAGLTWTRTAPLVTTLKGRGSSARAEVAYARSRAGLVYMSLDNSPDATGARGEVWKSEDGGVNWSQLSVPKHLNEQGDYDNTIWVDPTNEQHVIVGGLDLYQSLDGGLTFNKISDWRFGLPGQPQPHADHHQIVSVPNFSSGNPIVYIGNDGGLYRSNNIFNASASGTGNWQNLNNGLAVTQFYGGAGLRAAGGRIIGGTQDNGALQYSFGTTWARTAGGDGGYAAVDPLDDSTFYGEYVYASVHRTIGGGSRQYICGGITEGLKDEGQTYCGANATEEANFIAPFILDPNDRDRMLVGAKSLWASNNVRINGLGGPVWSAIKAPVNLASQTRNYINAIAVQPGDSNVIWVGYNATNSTSTPAQIYKTTNGLDAAPAWALKSRSGMPNAQISRITIDEGNPDRVWVTYTGFSPNRLWETSDGGTTWRSITGNLPAVSLYDIKRHPVRPDWLYVAAANGVYTSENGGQTWNTSNDGPASVRVRELFWYDQSTLVAATFGRGMFRATVSAGAALNYSDLWWGGTSENGWGMTVQQHGNLQFNVFFVYDGNGKPVWYVMPGCTWNSDFTVCNGQLYKPTGSPLNTYNPAQFAAGAVAGNVTLNYTSASTATLQYVINGVAGQKSIQRQVFGAVDNTSGLKVGDMWWGGSSQNGWGVSISQQYRTLFAAWYTYDLGGNVTWFTMPGGAWSGNTYSGVIAATTSSPWIGVPYNAAQFAASVVGNVSFAFSDANNATMTYSFTGGPFAGTTQSRPIVRQPY